MRILAILGGCFMAAALVVIPLSVVSAAPALAQDSTIGLHDAIGWTFPYLGEIAVLLVSFAVGWVSLLVKKKLGIDIEARHREALHSALMSGVNLALARGESISKSTRFDTKSDAVATAMRYVFTSTPAAIRYFGLTPERVADMIESKLPAYAEDAGAPPAKKSAAAR